MPRYRDPQTEVVENYSIFQNDVRKILKAINIMDIVGYLSVQKQNNLGQKHQVMTSDQCVVQCGPMFNLPRPILCSVYEKRYDW